MYTISSLAGQARRAETPPLFPRQRAFCARLRGPGRSGLPGQAEKAADRPFQRGGLGGRTLEAACFDQLGFQKAFTVRPVEQDLISVHVPNCREPGRPWAVQAVNNSALSPTAT